MTTDPNPDQAANLSRAFDAAYGPLEFVQHVGDDDAYRRGPDKGGVLLVVPGIWTSMPDELLGALRARRKASVTGRCPNCDGVARPTATAVEHEDDCPARDELIAAPFAAWRRQVGQYARGRRLLEDPALPRPR